MLTVRPVVVRHEGLLGRDESWKRTAVGIVWMAGGGRGPPTISTVYGWECNGEYVVVVSQFLSNNLGAFSSNCRETDGKNE